MNDLTKKMQVAPASFDKLFPSAKNVILNGVYATEQCPAEVRPGTNPSSFSTFLKVSLCSISSLARP